MGKVTVRVVVLSVHPWLRLLRLCPRDGVVVVLVPVMAALLLGGTGASSLWGAAASVAVALLWWSATWGYFTLLGAGGRDALQLSVTPRRLSAVVVACSVMALLLALLLDTRMVLLLLLPMVVTALYPWLLRHSYLADGVLGVAVAALVMLVQGALGLWPDKTSLLLATALLPWVVAWRVVQRWPHYSDDAERGVRSLASMFGPACPALVAGLQLFFLIGWWLLGQQAQLHHPFIIGWVSALLVAVAHYLVMLRNDVAHQQRLLILHALMGGGLVVSLLVARLSP